MKWNATICNFSIYYSHIVLLLLTYVIPYITTCTKHYHLHIQHGGLHQGDARSSPTMQGFLQQNHQKPLRSFKSKLKKCHLFKQKEHEQYAKLLAKSD